MPPKSSHGCAEVRQQGGKAVDVASSQHRDVPVARRPTFLGHYLGLIGMHANAD